METHASSPRSEPPHTEETVPSSHTYAYGRRYLNSALLVYALSFSVLTGLAWYIFNSLPDLTGALITLGILGVASINLILFLQQPKKVILRPEHLEVRLLFGMRRVPYHRIERLHWKRSHNPLGGLRPRDVLLIELKNGNWIHLDHMKGRLKRIRGILETRVYGK